MLAVDVRRDATTFGCEVVAHGGRRPTGCDAITRMCEGAERGAGEILLTHMDRDGTQGNYDLAPLEAANATVALPVIAVKPSQRH